MNEKCQVGCPPNNIVQQLKFDYQTALEIEEDLRRQVNEMRRRLSAQSRQRFDLGKRLEAARKARA